MRKDFTQQTTAQMPAVSGPDFFYLELRYKLTKDRINQITKTANQAAAFFPGIIFSAAEGGLQLNHSLPQFLLHLRRPEIAVSQVEPGAIFRQFIDYIQLLNISGYQSKTSDDARPGHSHMDSEAIKGLSDQHIIAEGCCPFEELAAISPCKLTDGYRQAIYDRKSPIEANQAGNELPDFLFNLPEIGCLANNSSRVNFS